MKAYRHYPYWVLRSDPAEPDDRIVAGTRTFAEARRRASELNRMLTERDGPPTRTPFVIYFARGATGHIPVDPRQTAILDQLHQEAG